MRTRTAAAGAAVLIAALTACSGGSSADDKATPPPAAPSAAPSSRPPTVLQFGGAYAWPDGLEVSVTGAKVFTDYSDGESPQPGYTDFRVTLKVTNKGAAAADLSELSTGVEGATNGGEAMAATFENGSKPLDGRLAAGESVTATEDQSMETRYGKRVVVVVQRVALDPAGETWPEFTGTVTG